MKKLLRNPLLYSFVLLLVGWFAMIPGKSAVSEVEFSGMGQNRPAVLPLVERNLGDQPFQVSFKLLMGARSNSRFAVVPDDCLLGMRVNGQTVDLQGVEGLCDYAKGIVVDLAPYLQVGENRVECFLHNNGGDAGLRFGVATDGLGAWTWFGVLWSALLLVVIALLLRRMRLGLPATAIILLGVVVRLVFYSYTGPLERTHDVGGHLEYMNIVAKQATLPAAQDCWSCYHPPLYYVASAPLVRLGDAQDPAWTPRLLQQAQMLQSFAVIALGVALLFRMLGGGAGAVLASLLWVLWPGLVITAPRIGNDVPFYLGQMLCLLFAQRWWESYRKSDMLLATLGAALALASKSTGLVTVAVWMGVYALGCLRRMRMDSWRVLLGAVLIVVLSVGFAQSRALVGWLGGGELSLVGNAGGLHSGLMVQNQIGNYLYFDLRDYLTVPYANAWNDAGGRQYFWNYLLKSSLFGEFRLWDTPLGLVLAGLLSFVSLGLVALAGVGVLHLRGRDVPLLLSAVAMLAGMIYLRVQYPYSCGNDFRYIAPVLLPWTYFAVRGGQTLASAGLKLLALLLIGLFALLSALILVLPVVLS